MNAFLNSLAQATLAASAIIAALLALRRFAGRLIPVKWRYWLWTLALVCLLLPVRIPSSLSVMKAMPDLSRTRNELPPSDGQSDVTAERGRTALTLAPAVQNAVEPAYAPNPATEPLPEPVIPEPVSRADFVITAEILFYLWITGAIGTFLYLTMINVHFLIKNRGAARCAKAEAVCGELRETLKIRRNVRVYASPNAQSPCLILFSRILMPPEALEDDTVLRHVLLHELCHMKQHDMGFLWIRNAALVAHWFNPLVWVFARAVNADMEMKCDADVIERLGGASVAEYGTTLLRFATRKRLPSRLVSATRLSSKASAMKRRIELLVEQPKKRLRVAVITGLIALALAACAVTGGGEERQATETEPASGTPAVGAIPKAFEAQIPNAEGAEAFPKSSEPESDEDSVGLMAFPISYKASFNRIALKPNEDGREANIMKAVEMTDGSVIEPGETWSFNEHVGPRTLENGWKEAPTNFGGMDNKEGNWDMAPGIAESDMFQMQVGGGAELVATALYDALLAMDVEIFSAERCAWPPSYAEIGLEVTVSTNGPDLVFRNNKEQAITIHMSVDTENQTVAGSISGTGVKPGTGVRLFSEIIDEIKPSEPNIIEDPNLPEGIEETVIKAHNGYVVQVYKDSLNLKSGETLKRELLYECTYRAVQGVKRIGTKKKPTDEANVKDLIATAKKLDGAKFVIGAVGPDEFDGEGFVYYCLKSVGADVEAMSAEEWTESGFTTIDSIKDAQAGDILCFNGHVAIYLGGYSMIDASSSTGKIRIARNIDQSSYWTHNFICAKRVL